MNSFAELPVSQGQILAEKYRVDYVLGQRGTGVVVAAEHLALQLYVAIKVLRTSATAETVERFFREARAAASIDSEHVVRVLDLDRLGSGEPYIVMEMLEGKTLATVLEERGPLPVSDAVDYLLHACEAIGKAHAAGIVHRELKPANLFLTQGDRGQPIVKVLDFGICKLAQPGGGPSGWLTGATTLLGSPSHMAPEQWVSATNVDASADVWALGTILYELLAGRPAFAGADLAEICASVQNGQPAPLGSVRPDVPPPVQEVVTRCLAKSPSHRPSTAATLARVIAPYASPVGRSVLDEIAKLAVDPSMPEQVAAVPTMVGSIRDPRMQSDAPSEPRSALSGAPSEPDGGARSFAAEAAAATPAGHGPEAGAVAAPGQVVAAAPTVAVRGATVHDPASDAAVGARGTSVSAPVLSSSPPPAPVDARSPRGAVAVAPPARTASGTIQLSAMPELAADAVAALTGPTGGSEGMAGPANRPAVATVGMPQSPSPALPPTVNMPSVPPAPPAGHAPAVAAAAVGPAAPAAAYGSLSPSPPAGGPGGPPPTWQPAASGVPPFPSGYPGPGQGSAGSYPAVAQGPAPGGPPPYGPPVAHPSAVAPTLVGPHASGGGVPWALIAIVIVIVVVATAITLAVLFG